MSWFNNMFSWNKSKDPQAPIKSLIRNAPPTGNSNIDANAKMKRELLGSFKKGGTVKKTGIYKLHKGEEVIPAKKKEMAGKMKSTKHEKCKVDKCNGRAKIAGFCSDCFPL